VRQRGACTTLPFSSSVILGTPGNDTLIGTAADETLVGGRGDDLYVF